jgi:hypothetical protein
VSADRTWGRLALYAAVSAGVWAASVGAVFWYLRRSLSAEAKARALTHPDSIGLPVVGFAVWLAMALAFVNLVLVLSALWKRRNARGRS